MASIKTIELSHNLSYLLSTISSPTISSSTITRSYHKTATMSPRVPNLGTLLNIRPSSLIRPRFASIPAPHALVASRSFTSDSQTTITLYKTLGDRINATNAEVKGLKRHIEETQRRVQVDHLVELRCLKKDVEKLEKAVEDIVREWHGDYGSREEKSLAW
ncbi:uncharacterized protein BDZ99DRAFT_154908 [Mytilinidion resinicola]|uniref:Uncharacterized protein n=1 Tax=Mytilinidion resinicola TaxID=574789 RepID=A0A6A6Y8M4_9PEZI|nr:uncharacterized protein BDZ99DRAFT_154908 [Mytilinidion resinicola]KAF2804314.1 hypothetical protein BDZ99DRAFT_154908 [Mytilinidion resinicola]